MHAHGRCQGRWEPKERLDGVDEARAVHLVDERTGNVLARLYPQDRTQNASGLRRSLEPLGSLFRITNSRWPSEKKVKMRAWLLDLRVGALIFAPITQSLKNETVIWANTTNDPNSHLCGVPSRGPGN